MLFIDLDNFTPLNDERGHDMGDLLLQEVANWLIASVRQIDTVATLGGDEFVVLINNLEFNSDAALNYADIVAKKVRQAIAVPFECRQ